MDGRHFANGFAVIRGVPDALYLNAFPLRLTAKFGGIAGVAWVTNKQSPIILPREVNQTRVMSDCEYGG